MVLKQYSRAVYQNCHNFFGSFDVVNNGLVNIVVTFFKLHNMLNTMKLLVANECI